MKLTREQFERYAAKRAPGWREQALASAATSGEVLEWTEEVFSALRRPPDPFGLGDAVAKVAEPIAKISDAIFGTHLVGCQSCAERRAALNRLLPDLKR